MDQETANNLDRAVARAAERLRGTSIGLASDPTQKGGPEQRLVLAFRAALAAEADWIVDDHETRFRGHLRWTRDPGGVDLVARVNGHLVLGEAKVSQPAEALWDAIKLADFQALGQAGRGYLIHAAGEREWQEGRPAIDLLHGSEPRSWKTTEVISTWSRAWGGLLRGSAGIYPIASAAEFKGIPVADVELGDPGYRLIVAAISTDATELMQDFDEDGWPSDYEPPRELRERSRPTRKPPIQGDRDPCHDYAWYPTMTLARIAEIVHSIGSDDEAYKCFRTRLCEERRWKEHELRTRVDPIRELRGEYIDEPDADVEARLIAEATRRRMQERGK